MTASIGTDEVAGETVEDVPEEPAEIQADAEPNTGAPQAKQKIRWSRVLAYGVLPGLVLVLAMAAGFVKWWDSSERQEATARIESVRAASDATVAMLSYRPDTVQRDLDAAKDRLTGTFRDSYSSLTDDVVAPAAIQKLITAVATVPGAASASATENHAVVLAFVNQTVTVGNEPPNNTNSSVRVTLDKVVGRWLISGFEPI